MPYGVPKNIGGDSPTNVKWMEHCVSRVEGQTDKKGRKLDKSRAIAICKSTLIKSRSKASTEEMPDFEEANFELSFILTTKEFPE